ncbi:MAG TPA: CPBP family glutamic-type intramembrane protease [Terriglobales bacterium]|nr:CPBP family glutamic-type intramembrane protease [Terriglobales bacterium]
MDPDLNPPHDTSLAEAREASPIAPGKLLPERNRSAAFTGESPAWGVGDVLGLAGVALLAIVFFSTVAVVLAQLFQHGTPVSEIVKDVRVILGAQAAAYLVLLLFMHMLIARRDDAPFPVAVKWNWPETRWAAWIVLGVLLAIVTQTVSSLLPIPKSLPIDSYFHDQASAWAMAAFGTLLAPLVEELFFRGFLYPVLARGLGVIAGVAITAALFAVVHSAQLAHAWAPLLVLFAVGVALTLVRARTGSVATSLLVHMGYNATLFTLVYFATDRFQHLERMTQ